MRNLSLKEMRSAFPKASGASFKDDFFIRDIVYREGKDVCLNYPCRFGGIVCYYCMAGSFNLSVGLDRYAVVKDCFIITLPGDIVSFSRVNLRDTAKLRIMAVSDELLSEMEFDHHHASSIFAYRMVHANIQYMTLIHHFRNLFRSIIIAEHAETAKSLVYMLRSMNLEITNLWTKLASAPERTYLKESKLTDTFIGLVARNHIAHRDLQFYAGQMGLTPKYLSSVIKKESGQSAVGWIVSYVILEARYYLIQTNYSVKQIAFELHFANQMDFYRYFLRHTGMTPSEYRKKEKSRSLSEAPEVSDYERNGDYD